MNETATDLLEIVWKAIPKDYKSRYRRTIWDQFENSVRSAAYTGSLGVFINSLCLKLNAKLLSESVEKIESILNSGNDHKLLRVLREETTLIVLMVRVRNEQRNKKAKERMEQEELQDLRPMFAQVLKDEEAS